MTLSGMAQTVGEEMYIYRNDGQVNGFLPDEVLSIEYSYMDAEGNSYDEIVTQIVNTADSVYMIPLAEIDSISFVTPKTEYKPGVINLSDQLLPYVVSSSDQSISFSGSTPSSIMPHVGDKLVTLEMNDKFPIGFVGEVIAISGNQVTCQKVSLEDVFDTYYGVSSTYGYQEDSYASRYSTHRAVDAYGNKDFRLGTFTWSQGAELNSKLFGSDKLALKYGTQLSIGITPSFHVISTLVVNKAEGTYFSACITGDMTFQETVSFCGGLEWSKDFLDTEWVKAPVAPLTYFYVKPGLFFRAAITASLNAVWTQRYTWGTAFDFSTKKRSVIKPSCGGRLASSSFDVEGALDGSVAVGGFLEVGLTVASSDIDKLCFRGELGAELIGHAVLYNSDIDAAAQETKVYERFRNSSIAVNAFVSTSVQAECGPWGISYSLPWNLSYNIKTWDVVPTFANTTFKQKLDPQTSADASVDMSGDCLIPVEVGLSVRKPDGTETASHYANTKFTNGNKQLSYTFANLSTNEDYTMYPKVKLFGYEMLASPSSEEEKQEYPVKITDFEQTGSSYEKGGYTNDGSTYDYKFDCAVTVELTSSEGVEDWGYVYKAPNGQNALISLRQYGSPYTDTRYAYYRNESSSTVTLYEYVKYTGDSEYYYGEPKDYQVSHKNETSCPDGNHPHAIDLGLPSGTKWACCNVGASKPEDYGGYYAWGETSEKNDYEWDTYKWYNRSDRTLSKYCTYYGYGTVDNKTTLEAADDAATANWGAPWRMPSLAQIQELLKNTTSTWTAENGVYGWKFTGSNGATVFLPAAGYRWGSDLNFTGTYGDYWSSTLDESGPGHAYDLYFSSGFADWGGYYNRDFGQSVRPVR